VINKLSGESQSNRGNVQVNMGFTGINYDNDPRYKNTGVQRPALTQHTAEKHFLQQLTALSSVILHLTNNTVFNDEHRNNIFSNMITNNSIISSNNNNIIEGYTASYTNKNIMIKGHVDSMNDTVNGYDSVICCNKHIRYGGQITRVSHLAYGKKCCSDYFKREKLMNIVSKSLYKKLDITPLNHIYMGEHLLGTQKKTMKIITAHMNKNVFYSGFAFIIQRVI
jgi:hypothetical protein